MIVIKNVDVLTALKEYPDNYFDGFLADAPYDLVGNSRNGSSQPGDLSTPFGRSGPSKVRRGFMGKEWDGTGIAFSVEMWKEIYRVLKPGAYLLCYGGTRTYHRLTCAIEDAGFEIRDCFMWLTGQGFPKSTDISKQLKKRGFNEEAEKWEGFGTAVKPAYEPIVLAMKPIEKTYAENAMKWGTGGLNIDDSRIVTGESINTHSRGNNTAFPKRVNEKTVEESGREKRQNLIDTTERAGRFPANLLLTHHPDCKVIGFDEWECHPDCPIDQLNKQAGIKKSGDNAIRTKVGSFVEHGGLGKPGDIQVTYGDAGFVSRFFYNGKVSKKEREKGLEELELKMQTEEYAGFSMRCKICGKHLVSGGDYCTCDETIYGPKADRMVNPVFHNNHPTLKPILLNQYLAKLILPPGGGKLLNPFSGVCSEAIGAFFAGWDEIISIEKEVDYVAIAEARVKYWTQFSSYEEGLKGKKNESTKGS